MSEKTTNQAQYDKMVNTPVYKLIITLSIPTILSMLVTNIYNMADTAFVGRLGTSASGAVGIVFGFMSILQAIGFMFGQGGGSILSRKLGARDVEGASVVASTSFFSALFLSTIVAIICFLNLDFVVKIFGSTETIAPYAKTYISFILAAAPFVVTSFTMNNILRYEGKAALGTAGMMTGAILNIVCDPIFMFVLKMGIAGAGLSTALSQFVSFSILLSMFLRRKTETRLSIRIFTKDIKVLGNIMATGVPSLLRQALGSLATIVLNLMASPYGDCAIAAMSIVSRISFFVFSIALGMGQGFQPVSAFNFGAGKYKRVRKAYRFTLVMSVLMMLILSAVAYGLSGDLVKIFRDDPEVIEIGTRALRLQLLAQIVMPPCMATEMLCQSTGRRFAAAMLSSLRSGLIFIPMLFIMSHLRGLAGIQEAQPIAIVLSAIPAVIYALNFFKDMPMEDSTAEAV